MAYNVKVKLPLPCFYRWIFFDINGINMGPLESSNTSAVCWKAIYVRTVSDKDRNGTMWSLFGPSLTPYGNCKIAKQLGDWRPWTPFEPIHRPNRRLLDFHGRIFRTAVDDVSYYALVKVEPFYAKTESGYEGIDYEFLNILRTKLNFRTKLTNNTDGEQGRMYDNGTWTGYIGLINEGKCVFTIAGLSINIGRMKAVDFTSPYLYGKVGFVVKNPVLLGRKLVLIKPLTPPLWIALIITFFACTGALYLITHILPCKSGVRNAYNIWFLLRTLGQQGTPSPAPARYSIRFFISSWWIFILVVLWSYSGILTTFMTYPGRRPAVDTVNKLKNALKARSIKYGTTQGTSFEYFLKALLGMKPTLVFVEEELHLHSMVHMGAVDPIFKESLEDPEAFQVPSVNEGMELVLQKQFAFVYLSMVIKWYMAKMGSSRFRLSQDVFGIDAIGVAIQKCHPCKKSFNYIIDRLEETGFFTKWYDDEFIKATIKGSPVSVQGIRALSLDDLQGAFYMLGIGMGSGLISLILEVCVGKLRRKKTRKRKRRNKR
ncbi:hypothetical protein JTE90_012963 [Oedothorax gibbosus]|uniref:Uncharacterized protein n=1 Tax=Oedothorax gibbosus TaxID=931172 RepID=A0AAV6TPW9_9ARAC|nr:hypothetical protein JTE90_012963 [Oedothorax gibbosus]